MDEGKAEPVPARTVTALDAGKAHEDALTPVGRHARSIIFHDQHRPLAHDQLHLPAFWQEFYRIVEQVGDTLWAEVWTDFPNLPPQINMIDVAVARLRRSIRAVVGDDLIETQRLKGYVISPANAQ